MALRAADNEYPDCLGEGQLTACFSYFIVHTPFVNIAKFTMTDHVRLANHNIRLALWYAPHVGDRLRALCPFGEGQSPLFHPSFLSV